jgi:hypothetical protein
MCDTSQQKNYCTDEEGDNKKIIALMRRGGFTSPI